MTARGKLVFTIIFLALVGYGVMKWWPQLRPDAPEARQTQSTGAGGSDNAEASAALTETQMEVPRLPPAGVYQSKDGIVDIELSEYAGYAGIIVANGGLEPNDNSIFTKKHGVKVRIKLSEE